MRASVSVTPDDFVNDEYIYYLSSSVYIRIMRIDECFVYNTINTPVAGYCIEAVVSDSSGNEVHTDQPVVIGQAGSICTITPVSDDSINGMQLSDSNLMDVTFGLSYDE